MRFVVATRSAHKLNELRDLLGSVPGLSLIDLEEAGVERSPEEEDIEVFDTFEENALAKARYYVARTGLPVLADDSGICVDALGGGPGVRSKRFSQRADLHGQALDDANNAHLLELLNKTPDPERSAHYRCALALVTPDGVEEIFTGRVDGFILREAAGDGGFGYDPLFLVDELGATFAQRPPAEKQRRSHRARAAAAALERLESLVAREAS